MRPRRTTQHDGLAIGQRLADGLKGFAPHHDDLTGGGGFEPLEILGQMPRDLIAVANDAIERHGGDGFEGSHVDMLLTPDDSVNAHHDRAIK